MSSLEEYESKLGKLTDYLESIPSLSKTFSKVEEDLNWWVKFQIDTEHHLSWRVVQELGFVLNYLSTGEKLPTVFMPVSPPPYLNGGVEFLSWVIETRQKNVDPEWVTEWLYGRLPRPVNDEKEWEMDE